MTAATPDTPFRHFEVVALRHMVGPEHSDAWLEKLAAESKLVSYNYSGSGYFLTVSHPMLPNERAVYSDPPVVGSVGEIQAGFVAFVQSGQLMLECHTWGPVDVPEDFRDMEVRVSLLSNHEAIRVPGNGEA